jgi:hypothetical protein
MKFEENLKCPHCRNGITSLRTIFVDPKSGKVSLSYGGCTSNFCNGRGLLKFTDIVIKELIQ